MGREVPVLERCNAITSDGGYCMRHPTMERDGEPVNGRCYLHGGHPEGQKDSVDDIGESHGIYTSRSNYYKKLSADEQIWIDKMIQSFVDDAPFDESNLGKMEILRNVSVDLHKIRRANSYIDEQGLNQTNYKTNNDGDTVQTEEENILNLPIDRLERSTTKRLKELGIFSGPAQDQADGVKSLAEVLSSNSEEEEE